MEIPHLSLEDYLSRICPSIPRLLRVLATCTTKLVIVLLEIVFRGAKKLIVIVVGVIASTTGLSIRRGRSISVLTCTRAGQRSIVLRTVIEDAISQIAR